MSRPPTPINLSESEQHELERLARKPTAEQRLAQRAKIILLAAEGHTNDYISSIVNIHPVKISKWRKRFATQRMNGLKDKPRSGRPLVYGHEARIAVIKKACKPPPAGSHWSVRDLERELKSRVGISKSQINEILRKVDLKPHLVDMWLNSNDPDFEAKETDIVGLYLNPPENALVISVDEKTQMQTLTPTHPSKPMIPGSPEKREFNYKRHGVSSLFAALLVHDGTVIADIKERHRHQEFLDFIKLIHRRTPSNMELHIIVDNLSAHKHADVFAWVKKHNRAHLHFTPTHASWLNQIELWFSILARKVLKRGFFKSKEDQARQIMAFIEEYNKNAVPFAWTYAGKPLSIY